MFEHDYARLLDDGVLIGAGWWDADAWLHALHEQAAKDGFRLAEGSAWLGGQATTHTLTLLRPDGSSYGYLPHDADGADAAATLRPLIDDDWGEAIQTARQRMEARRYAVVVGAAGRIVSRTADDTGERRLAIEREHATDELVRKQRSNREWLRQHRPVNARTLLIDYQLLLRDGFVAAPSRRLTLEWHLRLAELAEADGFTVERVAEHNWEYGFETDAAMQLCSPRGESYGSCFGFRSTPPIDRNTLRQCIERDWGERLAEARHRTARSVSAG